MPDILVDNDIILKSCCYSIDAPLLELFDDIGAVPFVLTVSRFVVSRRITSNRFLLDRERARTSFEQLIGRLQEVEPTEAELAIAAEFEASAQGLNLELDGGESQLLAILLERRISLLLTGDKRAIVAIERIAAEKLPSPSVCCLEQLMATILGLIGLVSLRDRVCAEPSVDRAMTSCFACLSDVVDAASVEEGLRSYISHLRKLSIHTLLEADNLSGFISQKDGVRGL